MQISSFLTELALSRAGPLQQDERVSRAWHGALDEYEVALGVGLDDLQLANGYPVVAHVPSHAHALEDLARRAARADGTRRAMPVGLAVRLGAAAEVVSLHATLEAPPLGARRSVHQVARGEHSGIYPLPKLDLGHVVHAELAQHAEALAHGFQVSGRRLVQPLPLHLVVAELDAHVAVRVLGLDLRDRTRADLDDRYRVGPTVLSEHLGRPDLLSYDSVNRHFVLSLVEWLYRSPAGALLGERTRA